MRLIQSDELQAALDAAINEKLCVQVWLGYARVLFIGFGNEVLAPVPLGGKHPIPQYQLQSHFADWSIEDETGVVADADGCAEAEAFAQRILGQKTTCWKFVDSSPALQVDFSDGTVLKITPMADTEEDLLHKGAWELRMPDGYYIHTRWDGTMFVLHKDELVSNEPS